MRNVSLAAYTNIAHTLQIRGMYVVDCHMYAASSEDVYNVCTHAHTNSHARTNTQMITHTHMYTHTHTHTAHRTPHTAHRTPHTAHRTPHTGRDPFFKMLTRSLSTFMNAMTGGDFTVYPFSTTNPKDYSNLLSVYLDAVFFPRLKHLDFLQEGSVPVPRLVPSHMHLFISTQSTQSLLCSKPSAVNTRTWAFYCWLNLTYLLTPSLLPSCSTAEIARLCTHRWRLEHEDPNATDTPITYKGVVYNEMKGALSSVDYLYAIKAQQQLLEGARTHARHAAPFHAPSGSAISQLSCLYSEIEIGIRIAGV